MVKRKEDVMKRTLLKTLVALMVLALMSSNAFAALPGDVKGQPYENAVSVLMEKGIITGDTDGNYHPNAELTRAQACTIIVKAMNPPAADLIVIDSEKASFNDLAGYGWSQGYIAYAVKKGVTNGYPDGSFKPGKNVTTNELVTMLLRAAGYSDEELGGTWPKNYMDKAAELGILASMPDPLPANATKWMAAELTFSLLDEIEAANGIPAEVKGIMDKVLGLAVKYAKQLDGEFGDQHVALMQSGKGWEYEGYADLKSKLDGFRIESGAYYVYCLVDMDPYDGHFEITVDGSEEPDDWLNPYDVEAQFLLAMNGTPAAAPTAWDNDVNDPVWSAFAPVYNSEGRVVAILGIDFPAPEILKYPEWNRDHIAAEE